MEAGAAAGLAEASAVAAAGAEAVAVLAAAAHQDAGDGAQQSMSISRTFRHLATPAWVVSSAFPKEALTKIEEAIAATERTHGGEIRFAVEGNLSARELWRGATARERALEVFA